MEDGEGNTNTAHGTRKWRGLKDASEGRREIGDGEKMQSKRTNQSKIHGNATRQTCYFVH